MTTPESNNLSYDELLKKYNELQLRVTRFSSVEQQMINIRHQLDNEIVRHNRMHKLNSKALEEMGDHEFSEMVAESIIDVFEVEFGICIITYNDSQKSRSYPGIEGLKSVNIEPIYKTLVDVADRKRKDNLLVFDEFESAVIQSSLPIHQAYGKHMTDPENGFEILLIGGVSRLGSFIYEPLDRERDAIFSLFAHQVYAQVKNRKKNKTIQEQVQKIEHNNLRLETLTEHLMSFGSDPEVNIQTLTKSCSTLLKADVVIYVRGNQCMFSNKLYKNEVCVHKNDETCVACFNELESLTGEARHEFIHNQILKNANRNPFGIEDCEYFYEQPVHLEGKASAWLILFFCCKRDLDESDLQILKIISAGVAVEELRNSYLERLSESEQKLNSIIRSQKEMIVRFLPDSTLLFVNKPFAESFGKLEEELLGKKASDLHTPIDSQKIGENIHRVLETKSMVSWVMEITPPHQRTRWEEWSTIPIFDEAGNIIQIQGVGRDITAQRLAEISRAEYAEALKSKMNELFYTNQKLEKLAHDNQELEQYAYLASHDLKEPLRTVENYLQLFIEDYGSSLDEQAFQFLNTITSATKRMNTLIKSLLDFSILGVGKSLNKVDMNDLVKVVIGDLEAMVHSTQAIVEVGHMPTMMIYETEIRQVFQNLIANAIKFRKPDIQPHIKIDATEETTGWKFSIADNGIGIAPEHFKRIFEIFQRLHSSAKYEGSGIGLANCKKIIKIHRGDIWLESTLGEGTTFYFTIPNIITYDQD